MGLRIEVDDEPRAGFAYVPGQRISGRVFFDIEKGKEKVNDVSIIYQGKIYTHVNVSNGQNRTRYKEQIYLFKFATTLFQGQEIMTKGARLEFPFEFWTPLGCNFERKHEGNDVFAPGGYVPLPPSFYHETHSYSYGGKCYIKYKLKLEINGSRIFHSKKVTRPIPLTSTSSTPSPQPEVGLLSYGLNEWQSRSLRKEGHSLKQKMQHVFTSNPELRTPSVAFRTSLTLPRWLSVQQSAPLSISVTHQKMGPTDPEEPTLVLTMLVVTIQGHTNLRVQRPLWSGSYHDDGKSLSGVTSHNFQPPKALMLDGSPMVLTPAWRLPSNLFSDSTIAPSFKTYTIGHSHTIKVEVTIKHVESGHEFTLKQKGQFQVLPSYIQTEGSDPPALPNGQDIPMPISQELPAYEELFEIPGGNHSVNSTARNHSEKPLADVKSLN